MIQEGFFHGKLGNLTKKKLEAMLAVFLVKIADKEGIIISWSKPLGTL